ncbi:hypothetical protein HJFPF1_12625 [Paramyrothecium foliicola]|nr:hypothetical protein HJFPF1_12625 [Paramyrothecium foliicola]
MSTSESASRTLRPVADAHWPKETSPHLDRILWTLNGPLASSVYVLADPLDLDSPKAAFFQQEDGHSSPHPIAQEPFLDSTTDFLTIESLELSSWEDWWWERHAEHAEMDDDLGDDDPEPTKCPECGEVCPTVSHESLVVEASEKPYITIQNYITAVHLWLMARREDILKAWHVRAKGAATSDPTWIVSAGSEYVGIMEEALWLMQKRWERSERDKANSSKSPASRVDTGADDSPV